MELNEAKNASAAGSRDRPNRRPHRSTLAVLDALGCLAVHNVVTAHPGYGQFVSCDTQAACGATGATRLRLLLCTLIDAPTGTQLPAASSWIWLKAGRAATGTATSATATATPLSGHRAVAAGAAAPPASAMAPGGAADSY